MVEVAAVETVRLPVAELVVAEPLELPLVITAQQEVPTPAEVVVVVEQEIPPDPMVAVESS